MSSLLFIPVVNVTSPLFLIDLGNILNGKIISKIINYYILVFCFRKLGCLVIIKANWGTAITLTTQPMLWKRRLLMSWTMAGVLENH